MKKLFAFAALLIASAVCFGATTVQRDRDDQKRVTRTLTRPAPFTGIVVTGGIDVEYRTSADGETRVTFAAPEDRIDDVEIYSRGGTLSVKLKDRTIVNRRNGSFKFRWNRGGIKVNGRNVRNYSSGRVTVRVESPSLEDVTIAGSSKVSIGGGLTTDRFNVSITGSGDVKADNVRCASAKFTVSGSGEIDMAELRCGRADMVVTGSGGVSIGGGKADEANCTVSGSGGVAAEAFAAESVMASVSGSGSVSCRAVHSIKASVTGSGTVSYYGNPEHVDRKVVGSGHIYKR